MFQNFLNSIIGALAYSQFLTLLVIAVLYFVESVVAIGVLVPGALLTFFLGFLASSNYLDPYLVISIAVSSAFLGEALSFYLGRKGSGLFSRQSGLFAQTNLARGEDFFNKHGAKGVLIGRFIGPLKSLIPFIAGLSGMKRLKFFLLNLLSVASWVLFYFYLGFFFGTAWDTVKLWTSRAELLGLAALLLFIFFYVLERVLVRRGPQFFALVKSVWFSVAGAIAENPEIKKIVARFPGFFFFLARRIDRKNFNGLPLTLLSIAFAYLLFQLFGVVEAIHNYSAIIQIDRRMESLATAFRNLTFVRIFLWITMLGKAQIIILFSLGASVIFWLKSRKDFILPLWVALIGSEAFVYFGKILVHRSRPAESVYFESSFSFPSGHATAAAAFFGFMLYFCWKTMDSWKRRLQLSFFIIALIALIGFSRIYLGVHYLSDVLAGFLLGSLWLLIGISIHTWQGFRRIAPAESPGPKVKLLTVGVLSTMLIGYLAFTAIDWPKITLAGLEEVGTPVITTNLLGAFTDLKLSRYSEMLNGAPQEPLSFIIYAKEDTLVSGIFKDAGWFAADPSNSRSIFRIAKAVLLNQSYDQAPMTPSFWQAEVNDFAFQKPTAEKSVRERHHARFWKTNFKTTDGKDVYVGTASLDIGIKWWVTHKINPDIDTEREYLFTNLEQTGLIDQAHKEKFVEPVLGKNASGDQFFTDGEIYILDLK
jgi:undecaprenyl-diphosphatase